MNSRKPDGLYPVREDPKIDAEIKIMLTTVCIKAGVVRIPHRHQAVFAAADYSFELNGLPLSVEYAESGQLIGMRELLEEAAVRPNDALILRLSNNTATISFVMRDRKTPANSETRAQNDLIANTEAQDEVKITRKVRINTQQYYPLEVSLPSALAQEKEHKTESVGINVTARRRAKSAESNQSVDHTHITAPSTAMGEGRSGYQVSEDFERWIAAADAPGVRQEISEDGALQPDLTGPGTHDPESANTVIKLVEEFISRPDIPAIIQTQKVADELNLALEQCEHALQRISEDHERVSRIRNGAYMIRQKRAATKV